MEPVEDIEAALNIDIPSADHLRLEDTRRLTGPGLLWDHPGAVVQIAYDGIDPDQVVDHWHRQARRVLDAVGWHDEHITERGFGGGHNLAISAPMDLLYSAIFVAQTAWHFAASGVLGQVPGDFDAMINDLKSVMQREANPALLALLTAGQARGIDVLCDDDEVSIGHGTGASTWPVVNLPDPGAIDWAAHRNVPIAMITGTNGKTTTTRLCAAIARTAGKVSGLTSTDFVGVGDDILDRGDYSGPGGARLLLRDQRLEVGFLEVARGGILRRGLPTRQVQVAVVTNVAADHLGQYGVNTVEELARAKFAVHRSLAKDGVLVLNADDPYVVAEAAQTTANIWWFSLDPTSPRITQAQAAQRPCAWLNGTVLMFDNGNGPRVIADVADVPLTMAGAARHNIQNTLAAICVSVAIGLDLDVIAQALTQFQSDPKDNPGRLNEFWVNGARVFVDFAHNLHSISAVAQTVSEIPAQRRFVLLSHAGDRSDADITDVTLAALSLGPDYVVAAEIEDYLRGRAFGEVTDLVVKTCRDKGIEGAQVMTAPTPTAGAQMILDMLQPDDVALLLILSERDQVFELLGK